MAASQEGIAKEMGEDQLMPVVQESRNLQMDCNQSAMTASNETHVKALTNRAGTASKKGRENENLTRERSLVIGRLEKEYEAQNSGEEEEGIENGPELVRQKPKGKNWKRQARIKCEKGAVKLETYLKKRPCHEQYGISPNQKKLRMASPTKPMPNQKQKSPPSVMLKLAWETMSVEELEMATPKTTDAAAEAGGQPRRQP